MTERREDTFLPIIGFNCSFFCNELTQTKGSSELTISLCIKEGAIEMCTLRFSRVHCVHFLAYS